MRICFWLEYYQIESRKKHTLHKRNIGVTFFPRANTAFLPEGFHSVHTCRRRRLAVKSFLLLPDTRCFFFSYPRPHAFVFKQTHTHTRVIYENKHLHTFAQSLSEVLSFRCPFEVCLRCKTDQNGARPDRSVKFGRDSRWSFPEQVVARQKRGRRFCPFNVPAAYDRHKAIRGEEKLIAFLRKWHTDLSPVVVYVISG